MSGPSKIVRRWHLPNIVLSVGWSGHKQRVRHMIELQQCGRCIDVGGRHGQADGSGLSRKRTGWCARCGARRHFPGWSTKPGLCWKFQPHLPNMTSPSTPCPCAVSSSSLRQGYSGNHTRQHRCQEIAWTTRRMPRVVHSRPRPATAPTPWRTCLRHGQQWPNCLTSSTTGRNTPRHPSVDLATDFRLLWDCVIESESS